MSNLEGTTAIVTGGARGIGRAVVEALAEAGASVMAADVLPEPADLPPGTAYTHLDVTSEDDWHRAVAATEAAFGPVSLLVNNAGIVEFGAIAEQSLKSFQHVIDVNLTGAWLGMHVVARSLRAAGGGVVINISSTAGLTGYPNLGAYTASKWGLRGLTKTAALEFARDGVRVCSVHPGPIRTPMTQGFDDTMTAGQPIARFGEPEEVARMVLFIAAEATYSTGSEFVVDGGAVAGSPLTASIR
ncbi:SDR family NAD(P)-dependent oxidoreductase [Actinokineospora sp. NPDC004072]